MNVKEIKQKLSMISSNADNAEVEVLKFADPAKLRNLYECRACLMREHGFFISFIKNAGLDSFDQFVNRTSRACGIEVERLSQIYDYAVEFGVVGNTHIVIHVSLLDFEIDVVDLGIGNEMIKPNPAANGRLAIYLHSKCFGMHEMVRYNHYIPSFYMTKRVGGIGTVLPSASAFNSGISESHSGCTFSSVDELRIVEERICEILGEDPSVLMHRAQEQRGASSAIGMTPTDAVRTESMTSITIEYPNEYL